MRRRRMLLAGVLLVALAACTPDSPAEEAAPPEGFREVTHPEARVAVPDDWTSGDAGDLADADADIQDVRLPDAPEGLPFGARLWHYGRTEDRTFTSPESPAGLQSDALPADREQTRREDLEIPGAEEGFLLQLQAQGTIVDEPVRFTYVVGLRDDGVAIMLSLVGTAEQLPDDTIDTIVDSFILTDA